MANISRPQIKILGVEISSVDLESSQKAIENFAQRSNDSTKYITLANTHGIIEAQKNELLNHAYRDSHLCLPDGMPIVWIAKKRGISQVERVSGPDLMLYFFNKTKNKYKHFFYGGTEKSKETLVSTLKTKYNLNVSGSYSPPFKELTEEEEKEIVKFINDTNTDIVWVGIGCPKQEIWMHKLHLKLNCKVLIGVGAAFDFISGTKPRAPLWMQNIGLEWLFRLITEPKRLWYRYLVLGPLFIFKVLLEELKIK